MMFSSSRGKCKNTIIGYEHLAKSTFTKSDESKAAGVSTSILRVDILSKTTVH